jgi:Leucine-rich repeat (LRR) protein
MEKINKSWPEGIQRFWKTFDRLGDVGQESGFYPDEGRLEICRCFNRQLDENILHDKEHIKILVIRKNELDEKSYRIISQLTNLKKLVLESVGPFILGLNVEKLENLTELVIASASNTILPPWILSIKNLQNLNISNTRIGGFPDCSQYTGYKKWRKLDISYTAIENLPDFKDGKLEQLRELRVANTGMEQIPSCYFTGALRLLDCSSTRISSLENFGEAENLEVFRCSDNAYLKELTGLRINRLRVLDVSHCAELRNLPAEGDYDKLEVVAVCGDFFDSLPLNLLEHCIGRGIHFKQESVKRLKGLNYDSGNLSRIPKGMKGVYIEGTFFRQMDFRYLVDNDSEFLRYYIEMDKKGELRPKHETKIMVLEDEQGVGDLFLHKLFPEHLQIYYEEYGGLKVLDTAGGELDYVRQKLDSDVDISIWTMESGVDEQFMHRIVFSDHDFFIVTLKEREGINYHERALYWLKEIEQCVRYATIAFAVVSESENDSVILSLKEVRQECGRKYFRFLKEVHNLCLQDTEAYVKLTDWLVEGIREKSNYEMKILPEWKSLRGQIVAYLDLRRIINQERFDSLLSFEENYGKNALVNYLIESKSLFHIRYSGKENYYFKTEWVISALFALLRVLREGILKDPFAMDELRTYLQTENIDFLDFFQDSESLGYLMDILEEIGVVFRDGSEYYNMLALPYMPAASAIHKEMQNTDLIMYKASYPILTEQMVSKISVVLLKHWQVVEQVQRYKGCLVFEVKEKGKSRGYLVARMITGCPGKIIFYVLADNATGRTGTAAVRILKERLVKVLDILQDSQSFPLWKAEIYIYYVVNGIGNFIPQTEISNYVNSGYASAFMAQYNAFVDIDEIYNEFF